MEYGITIYHTNKGNSLEKIRKLQNAGIRTAMRYRMSITINVMTVEAGIMDIDNRCELIANRYVAKHRQRTTRRSEGGTRRETNSYWRKRSERRKQARK